MSTVAKRGRVVSTNREYFTYLFELLCTSPLEPCVFHMTLRLDLCAGSSSQDVKRTSARFPELGTKCSQVPIAVDRSRPLADAGAIFCGHAKPALVHMRDRVANTNYEYFTSHYELLCTSLRENQQPRVSHNSSHPHVELMHMSSSSRVLSIR